MYKNKQLLARRAIEEYLKSGERISVREEEVAKEWREWGTCFVTLKINNDLRGCIGNVEPFEPLYKNVVRNALAAAFSDPRFPPLQLNELKDLTIEVSVLSTPKDYQPKNTEELLKFLKKEKPGLILEKDGTRALFLPQVWEELPRPEEFLSHLCMKAGLEADEWKNQGIKYQIFRIN